MWLGSSGHCSNLFSSYSHMGTGSNGIYWVQVRPVTALGSNYQRPYSPCTLTYTASGLTHQH